jgi:hypothetical protein
MRPVKYDLKAFGGLYVTRIKELKMGSWGLGIPGSEDRIESQQGITLKKKGGPQK